MGREERRKSREISIQVLYSYYLSGNPMDQIIQTIVAFNEFPAYDEEHMRQLVRSTISNTDAIDSRIKERAVNWDFDRIAVIDKIIMRQAIAEFLYLDDVPPKVTMSEAIELAKDFSTVDSFSFINGVLDRVYHDLIEEGRIIPSNYPKKDKEKRQPSTSPEQ